MSSIFYFFFGFRLDAVKLGNNLDHKLMMYNQLESDEALNYTYSEEFRCVVHFILMVIVGADSKLQRQQVMGFPVYFLVLRAHVCHV